MVGDFASREAAEAVYYRITGQEFSEAYAEDGRLRLMHSAAELLAAVEWAVPIVFTQAQVAEDAGHPRVAEKYGRVFNQMVAAYTLATGHGPEFDRDELNQNYDHGSLEAVAREYGRRAEADRRGDQQPAAMPPVSGAAQGSNDNGRQSSEANHDRLGDAPEIVHLDEQDRYFLVWQAHDPSAAAAGWAAFPQDYRLAISVWAASPQAAYELTSWGGWWEADEVEVIGDNVRSTRPGDVIVGPGGKAYRIKEGAVAEIDASSEKAASDELPLERVERQLRDWKHEHSTEFIPDPATGRIGPGTHRHEQDAWGAASEADKLRVLEAVPDWADVDDRQKEAVLAREVDFSRITRDELNGIFEEIGPSEVDERPARRLFDEANFAMALTGDDKRPFDEQLAKVRDTTRNLVESVLLDVWPRAGAIVDFGIDSQLHYEALHHGLRNGEIMPEALDAALGNGASLTTLARAAASNPHRDIVFHTSWDALLGRPEFTEASEATPAAAAKDDARRPSPGEIAREKPKPGGQRENTAEPKPEPARNR